MKQAVLLQAVAKFGISQHIYPTYHRSKVAKSASSYMQLYCCMALCMGVLWQAPNTAWRHRDAAASTGDESTFGVIDYMLEHAFVLTVHQIFFGGTCQKSSKP